MKKILCFLLCFCLFVPIFLYPSTKAFAAMDAPQVVTGVKVISVSGTPAIGWDAVNGYYADIEWDSGVFPSPGGGAQANYYNVYVQEVSKNGGGLGNPTLRDSERGILHDGAQQKQTRRIGSLKSGTIYFFTVRAYYTISDIINNTVTSSPLSGSSVAAKAMTLLALTCEKDSSSSIKIIWDDVWQESRTRATFRIYVSDDKNFGNTYPYTVTSTQIEPSGPVKVETGGKLSLIYNVPNAGRVYYAKVEVSLDDTSVSFISTSQTGMESTYIIVTTTLIGIMDDNALWRMDWSPVVTGVTDPSIKVSYIIKKSSNKSTSNILQFVAEVQNTSYYVTLPKGDEDTYYVIEANVTKNGEPYYGELLITSDKIYFIEQEIPFIPPAPEIVPYFKDSTGQYIISSEDIKEGDQVTFEGELKSDSAALLWRPPLLSNNEIDENTFYDIWLLEKWNPATDNLTETGKIASDIKFGSGSANAVKDGEKIIGYKYPVTGLKPNTTYYMVIVAKKTYAELVDGVLKNVVYKSASSYIVFKTPLKDRIDVPVAPSRPPLAIKREQNQYDGKYLIGDIWATLQTRDSWYEVYNAGTGKWEYVRTTKLYPGDTTIEYDPQQYPPDDKNYRKVQYDKGVTLSVGLSKYTEGMDITSLPTNFITGIPVTPNDEDEDETLNIDLIKHNINMYLNNLTPNTTYIVWLRAERDGAASECSDAIVFTTLPNIPPQAERPTVPHFTFGYASDTYVELLWDFNYAYKYYVKYGTEDNIDKATNTVEVPVGFFYDNSILKIENLKSDTVYYFWIQAETYLDSNTPGYKSEWSDSYSLKTLSDIPPLTPKGFGIKLNGIEKNSITYEWIMETGMKYKLEVSTDLAFTKPLAFDGIEASEKKVTGLLSNHRYYARLFAYDPKKELWSPPTHVVSAKTLKSSDEYDSGFDIDNPITGDYVIKSPYIVDGYWDIYITGINADRFIEKLLTGNELDWLLDVSAPPAYAKAVRMTISSKVFNAFEKISGNLFIKAEGITLRAGPGIFNKEKTKLSLKGELDLRLIISYDTKKATSGISMLTPITGIGAYYMQGTNETAFTGFGTPLEIIYDYTKSTWFTENRTDGYAQAMNTASWKRKTTTAYFDPDIREGEVRFNVGEPSYVGFGEKNSDFYTDISGSWAREYINKVAYKYELKSISGDKIRPNDKITIYEAVMLVFDVMDSSTGVDPLTVAAKSGMITAQDSYNEDAYLTREGAIRLNVKMYELMTRSRAKSSGGEDTFRDQINVSNELIEYTKFAIENGIIIPFNKDYLRPSQEITREEFLVSFARTLALSGKIN